MHRLAKRTERRAAFLVGSIIALQSLAGCGSSSDEDSSRLPPAACDPDTSRKYDVKSYDLHAAFDWQAGSLAATVKIDAQLESAVHGVELDSRVTRVRSVRVDGKPAAFRVHETAGTLCVGIGRQTSAEATDVTLEVTYEAGRSLGLITSAGRDADPVTTRVVYTRGEPNLTARWMPGNH
ncbi:MAG TPA: hypothetical protein VK524_05685, partial [Polyangiaceae bacterium]|nr:hypothetical protein [Polyangiaceae bacterium]